MIELVLNISPAMREAKSKFWMGLKSNPICDPEHISLTAATTLTKEKRLKTWWDKPGFKEWFANEHEFEINLESAKHIALNALVDVMQNPDSPASAVVSAAKQIMEQANKSTKTEDDTIKLLEKIAGITDITELQKLAK